MFDIDSALRTLVEREGSDLHVKVGSPPVARMHGELIPLEGFGELSAEDTEKAFHDIAEARSLAEFEEDGEADFSYAMEGVSRFRVNAFKQRGSISIVCRAIPFEIRSIEELGLPEVVRDAGRGAARDHPRHRHHRLGQEHDAGGDDRPHQPHPGRGTSSRSRTRSSTCTKTSARSSTSAKSAPTPRASDGRCGGSCARTPT